MQTNKEGQKKVNIILEQYPEAERKQLEEILDTYNKATQILDRTGYYSKKESVVKTISANSDSVEKNF